MATLESLDELLQDELKDIYDAEKQLTKALPKMAKNATNEDLKQAFEEHLRQTEQHIERLEQVFEQLELPDGAARRASRLSARQPTGRRRPTASLKNRARCRQRTADLAAPRLHGSPQPMVPATILVADHDTISARFLQRLLTREGHHIR